MKSVAFLLAVIDSKIGGRRQDGLVLEVGFFGVLLPLCLLTYRCVEVPGRAWGRGLARRVGPRGGRQRHPASQAGA
ncbi:hypothetical protein [Streptomyces sp. NPDC056948]|uniref:hypothetical protein n=1 Tax=Streptomyces sp. NPDC056948 TaxID=3345975 RepID=UPI00363F9739